MSAYGYLKHNELSDYAIAHHGIKGQKWGIRRYQNADGSLTAEGRKRYGKKLEKSLSNNITDKVLKGEKINKNQQMVEYGNKLLKTVDMIDQDGSIDKDPKRSRRAAMTGMKAYNKVFAGRDILDLHSKGDIDWFLYEDQTPGMATVADLANQGYNKKQINALIEASYRNQDYDNRKSGMFGLSEGYYKLNDDYIDACIKNKQK